MGYWRGMSVEGISKSAGALGALGLVFGLSADKVIDTTFGIYDRQEKAIDSEYSNKRENLLKLVEYWSAEGEVRDKVLYTAILAQGGLLPDESICSVIAYAIDTNGYEQVNRVLSSAFTKEFRAEHLTQPQCDVDSYINPAAETVVVVDTGPKPAATGSLVCPTGALFTQFGAKNGVDFGKTLATSRVGFTIEAPEYIDGFDAKHVVIRYFHEPDAKIASQWHDYFQATWPDIDFKYAYIQGFEDRIGPARFELWWPNSIPPAEPKAFVDCGAAAS